MKAELESYLISIGAAEITILNEPRTGEGVHGQKIGVWTKSGLTAFRWVCITFSSGSWLLFKTIDLDNIYVQNCRYRFELFCV